MSALAYIGDPLQCAAYRLAGFATWSPEPGAELAALQAALAGTQAVFISTEMALRLPRSRLEKALAAGSPLVAIVPRAGGRASELDPAERVRSQLGLER
jgi:vacuolar-type H+-ATPase subunit F/Vma7